VTAGMPYLSHLAKREELHSLHHILKGLKTLSRKEYKPPPATDVVIVDTADHATFDAGKGGYFHPQMRTNTGMIIPASDMLLRDFLLQAEWRKLARNEFTLYLQGKPARAETAGGDGRKLDDFHSLISVVPMPPLPGDAMHFRLSWDLRPNRTSLLWASLHLLDDSGKMASIGKGPIGLEVESGRTTEAWSVRLPAALKPGKYRGVILIYDPFEAPAPGGKARFKRVSFDVGEFHL